MRSVLLAGCLAVLSCSAPDESIPATTLPVVPVGGQQPPAADPKPTSARQDVPGLDLLATAIAQGREPELWSDAGETARQARQAMLAARQAGSSLALDAALGTTDALLAWRALREYGSVASQGPADLARSWSGARATLLQGVVTLLTVSQGHHPQTDEVLVDLLFRSGQAARAAQELGAALRRWPAHPPLFALARNWRDDIPEPGALASQLQAQLTSPDAAIPGFAAQAWATRGYLSLSWGLRVEDAGDAERAARLYEAGAEALARAAGPAQVLDEWELSSRRADCLVNAGRLRYAAAEHAIGTEGLDAAQPVLTLAEQDYVGALRAVPDDPDATRGIASTGDLYYQAGSLEGIRDFFGRVAPQFENAEWWNNYAFFCRETGQYEESYAAYERCIALAPDNPRWVNDTGLILLYHLDRDLDHAEELFRRAWSLGRKVCENPFVSKESYDDAFLGYTDAMHNLSLLLARRGDLRQAHEVNAELLRISPDREDAQQFKAELDRALAEHGPSDGAGTS